jgi:predicted nucleic acid-binding protein
MSASAYLDSSALLKLVVHETETPALEADLANRDGVVTSRLAVLECRRAARRASHPRVLQRVDDVFDALYLIEMTPAILEQAAALGPPLLRSLDGIHLATALSIDEPTLELITYDARLAAAAKAYGLVAVHPGRRTLRQA